MSYEFWRKWLMVASALFVVLQSIGWAVLGSFDPLVYMINMPPPDSLVDKPFLTPRGHFKPLFWDLWDRRLLVSLF
jgi:uncharacterized membrane protein SpoIIM required for sporulation